MLRRGAAAPFIANPLLGIGYMCLAVSLFPLLNGSVKYLAAGYPIPEIIWARYSGHLLVALIAFVPMHGRLLLVSKRPAMQWLRSLLLLGSTAFYFTGLSMVALPLAAAISFTGPLIITALSVPMLGEQVGVRRWTAVVIGFIGAMVIIRPGLGGDDWPAVLILASAVCYALYAIFTRKIAGYDNAETTITYTALIGVLVSSLMLPFSDPIWPIDGFDWLIFAGTGLWAGIGHYLVVKAYQHAPAPVVSPFGYGQLIGATIIGYFVFGDFPDLWTWIGTGIIVLSGLYIIQREGFLRRR